MGPTGYGVILGLLVFAAIICAVNWLLNRRKQAPRRVFIYDPLDGYEVPPVTMRDIERMEWWPQGALWRDE